MKKFLLATGLFATGFLALNLLLYFFLFKPMLYKEYIVGKKEMENYKIFLFSDSHGMVLDQALLDKAGIYNFSYGSDSYRDMFFKLEYIIDNDIRPSAVIVTADDHTLSKYRNELNNRQRSIYYTGYQAYNTYYPTNFINYLYLKYAYRFLPMLNPGNSGLFNKLIITLIETSNDSDDQKFVSWLERKNKQGKCKNRKKIQYPNKEVATEMSDALQDIFLLCRENQIKVYGVKFPLTKIYLKVLDGASYHADSVFLANSLPILDYKEVFKENDSLFLDQDHLNASGAVKFLEFLKSDMAEDSFQEK